VNLKNSFWTKKEAQQNVDAVPLVNVLANNAD